MLSLSKSDHIKRIQLYIKTVDEEHQVKWQLLSFGYCSQCSKVSTIRGFYCTSRQLMMNIKLYGKHCTSISYWNLQSIEYYQKDSIITLSPLDSRQLFIINK